MKEESIEDENENEEDDDVEVEIEPSLVFDTT
jgi:hypothetical protein